MWGLFYDTGYDTCPEDAHASAMNTYTFFWMNRRTSMASRLALESPETLMVWLEDNLSNLSEECMQRGSEGLNESFGLKDAVRAADGKACQLQGYRIKPFGHTLV